MNTTDRSERKPFQCFMGQWEGLSKTFDVNGSFLEATQVHMEISWKDSDTFKQLEHIKHLYQIGEVSLQSEIKVTGKTAFAETPHLYLQATELTPDTYFFRVRSGASHTTLHNVHYFINRNHRRVITHKIKDGQTFVFQAQDFVRIE